MVILDVMALAGGFVLRAVAGAVVVGVPISPWLYVCTMLLALFLALGKRRQELVLLEGNAGEHRPALEQYTVALLDHLLQVVTTSLLVAYMLYTFFAETLPRNRAMMLTIPFVLYGLFRYLYLVYARGEGGSPEEVLLRDRPMALCVVLWAARLGGDPLGRPPGMTGAGAPALGESCDENCHHRWRRLPRLPPGTDLRRERGHARDRGRGPRRSGRLPRRHRVPRRGRARPGRRRPRPPGGAAGAGRADVVVHAAAALPLWSPADIRSTNVGGTRTVLQEARAAGVPRTVFVSSTAVYGVPEKHPLEEDDPLVGVGAYGESKIGAERVCTEFRARGYCVPVLRPKTFLGTGRLGVFQILYDWVRDGKRIPILGSGRNRYQLLEVDDLCAAIWAAATAPPALANSTFNVGATQFESVAADVGALCAHAGSGARPFPVPAAPAKLALRALEAVHLSPLYRWVYGTADKDSVRLIRPPPEGARLAPALQQRGGPDPGLRLVPRPPRRARRRRGGAESTGVTHRVAWDQGALKLLKRWL